MASQNAPRMSLVAQFDDLGRHTNVLINGGLEKEFKTFVESQVHLFRRYKQAEAEIQELKNKNNDLEIEKLRNQNNILEIEELQCKNNALEAEKNKFELQIKHMKDLLAREVEKRRQMERQIAVIKEVLMSDGNAIDNQTKEKLFFLSTTTYKVPEDDSQARLNTIEESIGCLLSPSDFDDTIEDSNPNVSLRRKRKSQGKNRSYGNCSQKKKKSGENVAFQLDETEEDARMEIDSTPDKKATDSSSSELNLFTPIEAAHQVHESDSGQTEGSIYDLRIRSAGTPPSSTPYVRKSTRGKISRTHTFVSKTVIRTDKCFPCGNMIKFCKQALKCTDCRITCHPECKEQCPLPCIPVTNTPNKVATGNIADYTSSSSPMIPSLIINCIKEIESRNLKEVGLYRVSGSERDVKDLKEKLLNGRSATNLSKMDVHAICGTVKEFLRSLKEPLIPTATWHIFVEAAEQTDEALSLSCCFDAVCDLPQPNKETLAFIVLHLKKVADSPVCRMPVENLAKVFGPTIVGYSSADPLDSNLLTETRQQCQVMQRLLMLPTDSWKSILNADLLEVFNRPEIKTPELTPVPVASRLGPIYASARKTRSPQVGRTSLTPRYSKHSKTRKRFFSPLK